MKISFQVIMSVILVFPIFINAQIQDMYISSTVEKYFDRNRTAPTLMSVDVVDDYMYGRTLKLVIRGHRNSKNEDIGFAFGAAAAIAAKANIPMETLWVEMEIRYKTMETTIAVAPAPCSIEAIVYKSRSFGFWWESCLNFL
ncbi:MAG: hypothetical protein K9N35_09245 [Candidatus Marinimicrobia bacterium]|nr:hypothetical protein [Candidatus Neomarinimicrobiota bacterium]